MIPYGKQDIIQSDIDAVTEVLSSDFLTQGNVVPLFEKKICDYTSAKYSVVVNSATSALHLLLQPIVDYIVAQKLILLILIVKPIIYHHKHSKKN